MRVVEWLGNISDAATLRMIAASRPDTHTHDHDLHHVGGLRSAQLQGVLSMTSIMMSANMLSAGSILLLEVNLSQSGADVFIWVAATYCYSILCLLKLRKIKRAGWRPVASSRATGKITLWSILMALMWSYPALAIMSTDSNVETTFISITTAGMITGGALALYPVPFAAALYACILTAATLPAVFWGSNKLVVPFLIVIAAFLAIIMVSIRRQAGIFILELDAKMNAENQLSVTRLMLDSVSGEGKQVAWRTDRESRIICSYHAFEAVLGLAPGANPATLQEMLLASGLHATDSISENALQGLINGNYSALLSEPVLLSNATGQTYKLAGNHTIDGSGIIIGYHGYIKDITEQTISAQRIVKLATRDQATGLLNYQEFSARAARYNSTRSTVMKRLFLFIDADNLKAVNDNFGHAAGDCLIIKIANEIERVVPLDSLMARKGGDEFVVLLAVEDADAAAQLVDKLLDALRCSFAYGPHRISFSCSIGASLGDIDKPFDLLELEADRALYDAKRCRGKGARFYDEVSGAEVTRSRGLITELSLALDEQTIDFFYQPIVSRNEFSIVGAEALLRWCHPKFGMISPLEVVAAAKATGLLSKLSIYAIRQACTDAAQWPPNRFVSVNMCATDFQNPQLSDTVLTLLKDIRFSPDRLWLEITESEAIGSCTPTMNNMIRLRAAGVKIAIDDFGAGYSSLNLFASNAFDVVKIDRALVASCTYFSNSRLILEAVRSVAQATGCTIVAEGVEAECEFHEMLAVGCQALQGYFFDKALPASVILERMWHTNRKCA